MMATTEVAGKVACPLFSAHIHLVLEWAKGYVKALEKSTYRVLSSREVFEPCAQRTLNLLFDLCTARLLNSYVPACHFMHTSGH